MIVNGNGNGNGRECDNDDTNTLESIEPNGLLQSWCTCNKLVPIVTVTSDK
jgi:hypothetical protein